MSINKEENKSVLYDRKFFNWLIIYRQDLLRGEFQEKLVQFLTEDYYQNLIKLSPEELKEKIKYDGFGMAIIDYNLDELVMEIQIDTLNDVFNSCKHLTARADSLFQDFQHWRNN